MNQANIKVGIKCNYSLLKVSDIKTLKLHCWKKKIRKGLQKKNIKYLAQIL